MAVVLRTPELTVTINEFGAEICSIKNKKEDEYIWQADATIWARHAPVLFPIVGRLKEDRFKYNDKEYSLTQHGFARDLKFILAEKKEQHCRFQLFSTEDTFTKYPFKFEFDIKYVLSSNKLLTNYKIVNSGNESMYFSLGAHPGFALNKMDDHFLELEKDELVLSKLKDGLLSSSSETISFKNKRLELKKELFENDALIFENSQIDLISLCSKASGKRITMLCKGWPYFGIWTKKECEKFICLEPWHGITDTVNTDQQLKNKKGIIHLPPKKEFNCNFELIFD